MAGETTLKQVRPIPAPTTSVLSIDVGPATRSAPPADTELPVRIDLVMLIEAPTVEEPLTKIPDPKLR